MHFLALLRLYLSAILTSLRGRDSRPDCERTTREDVINARRARWSRLDAVR